MRISLLTLFFFVSLVAQSQIPNFSWAKNMGGASHDLANAIAVDASGNVYTTGRFEGPADFDPNAGVYNLNVAGAIGLDDVFISKLDAYGNFIWAKSIGSTGEDISYAITVDAANNVYVTGLFTGSVDFDPGPGVFNLSSSGAYDIFILKLNPSGNFAWAKRMGGTTDDRGYSIALDSSGNIFTTGLFTGTADFDPGSPVYNLTSFGTYDVFISKLDASGNFVWVKQMGGTAYDQGISLALDANQNIYITGFFDDIADFDPGPGITNLVSNGNRDVFITKLNSMGSFIWAKSFGTTTEEQITSITIDATGNIYTTGSFRGTVDFDPNAGIFNLTASTYSDAFISKLDPSGNFLMAKNFGGNSNTYTNAIKVDPYGNIYTTGSFKGTTDFDPDAGTYNLSSNTLGHPDIFILKLNASGSFVSAQILGAGNEDVGSAIVLDASGNLCVTGWFNNSVDFDPSASVKALVSAGLSDIFVLKLSKYGTGISETSMNEGIKIYPNPSSGRYTITLPNSVEYSGIEVYNCLGELIYLNSSLEAMNIFDLTNQAKGLYLMKFYHAGLIEIKTIIVE